VFLGKLKGQVSQRTDRYVDVEEKAQCGACLPSGLLSRSDPDFLSSFDPFVNCNVWVRRLWAANFVNFDKEAYILKNSISSMLYHNETTYGIKSPRMRQNTERISIWQYSQLFLRVSEEYLVKFDVRSVESQHLLFNLKQNLRILNEVGQFLLVLLIRYE
jgi:hypothetical protein